MKHSLIPGLILSSVVVAGCGKKNEPTPEAAASAQEQSQAPAATAAPVQDDPERAKKQALLDFANMEDKYINDPSAQWAATAKASSTFGDDNGREPSSSNLASNATGAVDGKTWTNNKQDVGTDWLEATFAKPVAATEVRVVFSSGEGVEAVSKVELQDTSGNWNTVWSGLSDVQVDDRGGRTWFVKTFEKTSYQATAVKITIANNVQRGYKVVDAVQLVGG